MSGALGAAFLTIGFFAILVRRRGSVWVLFPLAVAGWGIMHASGVHATIASVILGFTLPTLARGDESMSLAELIEHLWRPISLGIAVPIFALFAAGVAPEPWALARAAGDPAAQSVSLGLGRGKPIAILLATLFLVKLIGAKLDPGVKWPVLVAVAAGVGFTVSLLIGGLSFDTASPHGARIKAAGLIGSLTSAALARFC